MNLYDLFEGATDVLYHYTGIRPALKVLQSGMFELSRSTGNKSEENYAPAGYDYFFSTTRSKTGDYHRMVGNGAVMFVLDGQWFGQRYKVKPIDYWDRSWLQTHDRTREAEDRVFSKTPAIPIGGVRAIHAFINEHNEWRSPELRTMLLQAKKLGLPIFMYNNEEAWRLQDTRKALTVQQMAPLLKGVMPVAHQYRPSTDYIKPWLELIHKKSKADLSPEGEKLRYNLVYYGSRYENEDSGLGNALANERKPGNTGYDSATKLIQAMRQSKLNSPLALKNALCQKWENIK
jgi:hypothetical protein